jgi:hypothetical protein
VILQVSNFYLNIAIFARDNDPEILRRTIFILLLIILVMQAGGLLLVYRINQQVIKQRMARIIEKEEIEAESLTLSLEDFRHCRLNRKEILWNGNMYDIKSCVVSGDSITLMVINDTREKEIAGKIKLLAGQSDPKKKDLPGKIIKLYTLSYIAQQVVDQIYYKPCIADIIYNFTNHYESFSGDILCPPPKSV